MKQRRLGKTRNFAAILIMAAPLVWGLGIPSPAFADCAGDNGCWCGDGNCPTLGCCGRDGQRQCCTGCFDSDCNTACDAGYVIEADALCHTPCVVRKGCSFPFGDGNCPTLGCCGGVGERQCCVGCIGSDAPSACAPGLTYGLGFCERPRTIGEDCGPAFPCKDGLQCIPFLQTCSPQAGEAILDRDSCLAFYSAEVHQGAIDANLTLNFGITSGAAVVAGASYELGNVYGQNGKYGCYLTYCVGAETDVAIGSAFCAGLTSDYVAFAGDSFVIVESGGEIVELTTSQNYKNGDCFISDPSPPCLNGTADCLGVGVGILPFSVGAYQCTTIVLTVIGSQPPTARCKDVTVCADINGSHANADINNGSSDPDGDALTTSQSPAGPYAIGSRLVTLTVTDGNNESSMCSGEVVVEDCTPPVVTNPAPIAACHDNMQLALAAAGGSVTQAASDNVGISLITFLPLPADQTCEVTFEMEAIDTSQNHSAPVPFATMIDPTAPTAMCNATDLPYEVGENCEAYVQFTGMITDNCCVDRDSVMVTVTKTSGTGTVTFNQATDCMIVYAPISDNPDANDPDYKVNVSCAIEVSGVTECRVDLKIELTGSDCCGKPLASACMDTATVVDKIAPIIGNPSPLAICYPDPLSAAMEGKDAVLAAARDNCTRHDFLTGNALLSSQECATTVLATVTDLCANKSMTVELPTFIDSEAPVVMCPDDLIVECGDPYEPGTASATDNCTLNPPVDLTVTEFPGNCQADGGIVAGGVSPPPKLTIERKFGTTDNSTAVTAGTDENPCDNLASCVQRIFIIDTTPPVITHCPGPITVKRGDKFCNDDVKRWLDSFTAEDKCASVELTNDAPECGFPAGKTSTVTFTAKDECWLMSQCTSTITVEPLERVASDQKGSLLVFSKVEIKWNAQGQLIQDAFLDISNDADRGGVDVQAYFINGDMQLEQIVDSSSGAILQDFEPGWNTADCRFHLTKNQPHFWSAARGSSKCQPFVVLDEDGPGRLDLDASDGSRILRGFVVMWAVKYHDPRFNANPNAPGYWQEIRWNDLKGDALLVNYAQGWAWEYNAYSYQAHCGATGEALLDCTSFDANGTCCTAEVIPGRLGMDGFEYDVNFDQLLLDFYASGSTALSGGGVSVMVDTDLTLHSMDIDVRQDGDGPILTKADFEIYNENESKFSGPRRCICCWDQTLLSNYVWNVSIPNHFLREKLGTDKGVARIDGVCSDDCDYLETCGIPRGRLRPAHTCGGGSDLDIVDSFSTPLLGLAAKVLTFSGARQNREWSGTNLHGFDTERSILRYDVSAGDHELLRGPRKR